MKIALLSDSHGNATALEAVIEDTKNQDVDGYIFVGDAVMKGPSPEICVEQIAKLKPLAWVIGNHEPIYNVMKEEYEEHPKFILGVIYDEYDRQFLSNAQIDMLLNLPIKQTVEIENLKVDVFHALPTKVDAATVDAFANQEYLEEMFIDSTSDIAVYGHVHDQILRRTLQDKLIINPGTIGMPTTWSEQVDTRANYAILTIEDTLSSIDFRKVNYDVEKEIQIAKKRELPYLDLYIDVIRNSNSNFWNNDFLKIYNKKMGYDIYAKQKFLRKAGI